MRILESVLYADDLTAARAFYTGVLGLEEISFDPERSLFMRVDQGVLIVFRPSKTLIPDAGVPAHGTTGPGHLAFSVTPEELDHWRTKLKDKDVEIEMEKRWAKGSRSIYFRDPAGNSLEFAEPALWGLTQRR